MPVKAFAEGDQVYGLLRLGEFNDALENPAMLIEEKVLAFQFLNRDIEGMIVEKDSAEDAALRASAVRERTFESRILSHINSLYFRLERALTQRFFAFRDGSSGVETPVPVNGGHSVWLEERSQRVAAVEFTGSCAKERTMRCLKQNEKRRRKIMPAPQRNRCVPLGFAFDSKVHRSDDVAVELDRDGVFADGLDRIVELDSALVDGVALRGQRIGDVG